ncbi:DUF255 domain-containing protein [Halopenitus persicus]|uniref:Thioredoxin domain-containing protein n=1 Tax=Halopenitus persicus TaxID=1048396 RepID=A0A1H3KUP7_9EURY|nr:DUF255 domain-containing protein [Halopenitus persicus]SDY55927.1 hypothetical protein SAMN05216564_106168 [Halopenitus persicus]
MTETHVEWREWGPDAFAAAAETDRPVLLALTATWCDGCHEMDAKTYGEPRIAANINESFVPIRVDVDRWPRIRERYNMGGFPSTVFLTPDGELLTGAGYLGPDGMRQVLESVRDRWAEDGAAAGRVPRALAGDLPPSGEVTRAIEEHLAGQLEVQFDADHAGWGDDAKFPLPRTVEFALKREQSQALRTLDAISTNLRDDVAGGFFRYAGTRDWSDVHHEKPIDTNAALTRAFANAYLHTGDAAYEEIAREAVGFLTDDLWTGIGVGGSIGPGEGRAYYARDADGRAGMTAPRRDHTVLAGGNALAADALLTHAAYTDDDRAREYAERILGTLERELVDASTGEVTRFLAEEPGGETDVLEDLARVVAAFTRAQGVLGEGIDLARTVADRAIETLFVEGSFLDGPRDGAGLLDHPFRPLDTNVEAATALLDLGVATGTDRYVDVARETAAAFAGATDRYGVQLASYGSLTARLCHGTPAVFVGTEPGTDLHRAAWRVADHEKVVVANAHRETVPTPWTPNAGEAIVGVADDRSDPAGTPDELLERVSALLE